MPLQLYLLGGFDCRSGTGDALTFPTSKVRALRAYLATNPEQGHRRDKLADLLWGDATAGEGPLLVRAGIDPANVDRAIAAIDHEVAALAADGPTPTELAETRAYLIGSIPSAYLVSRWVAGIDIRVAGEGNVGARNAYHVVGPMWGVVVFLMDVTKGGIVVCGGW